MTMRINIVKDNNFDLPRYATLQSAGCDLQAVCPEGGILVAARDSAVISTGIHIALPAGYEAQVRGRSGLNFKHGIIVPTGTIDTDYRGEIKVKVYNLSDKDYYINHGDAIAQLVIAPCVQAWWNWVQELDATERGEGGFGHTGR